MSANQKIILAIFIVYLALNAAIGIIFSNRQIKNSIHPPRKNSSSVEEI